MTSPTINDVAERAGVSKSLVSRVLRDSPKVSPQAREAVKAAMAALGYRPNAAARALVRRRSQTIGVIVTDFHNPFFADVIDGIDELAAEHGYTTLVLNGKRSARAEAEALETLLELRADGIVTAPVELRRAALAQAARTTPVVTLTRTPRLPRVDSVVNDDVGGAGLAVGHLLELGHRRITMVNGTEERAGRDRRRGYEEAMAAAGLERRIHVLPGGYTESGGYRAVRDLLAGDDVPTAVFAGNDLAALGVLHALAEAGLDVPGDVSVVGYDNTSLAALPQVSLTTVHQPRREIGLAAMDALLKRIEQRNRPASHVLIPPFLMTRRSTGPPPAAGAERPARRVRAA